MDTLFRIAIPFVTLFLGFAIGIWAEQLRHRDERQGLRDRLASALWNERELRREVKRLRRYIDTNWYGEVAMEVEEYLVGRVQSE